MLLILIMNKFTSASYLKLLLSTQCQSWIPLSVRNSSSSWWSRGSVRSRTIPDFLALVELTSYLDEALCDASLNTACRALSSEDGPRADFAAFLEWTLASKGSPHTICPVDDLARSTPDPEPSPPTPRGVEHQPKLTNEISCLQSSMLVGVSWSGAA